MVRHIHTKAHEVAREILGRNWRVADLENYLKARFAESAMRCFACARVTNPMYKCDVSQLTYCLDCWPRIECPRYHGENCVTIFVDDDDERAVGMPRVFVFATVETQYAAEVQLETINHFVEQGYEVFQNSIVDPGFLGRLANRWRRHRRIFTQILRGKHK